MIFILEDTWTSNSEADDIINYAKINNIECKILSVRELYDYNSYDFLKSIYFSNTDIVQYHLCRINRMDLIPNTYDERFNIFFVNRQIEKMSLAEFDKKYQGTIKFIKPYDNNKDFDGRLISNITDFESYGIQIPNLNKQIYCADPILFLSEVRLLIGNNKLYGHGHICKNKIDNYLDDKKFIQQIINLSEGDYLCVDIGFMFDEKLKKFCWTIIEINPPFSLDDYNIPFPDYIKFCIDACLNIFNNI
jgi:hypothetical protein